MHPFSVGELVVCINEEPIPGRAPWAGESWVRVNHVYRIRKTGYNEEEEPGVSLIGLGGANPFRWWYAWRFRPVQPADDDFIAMLRALPRHDAPVRKPEDVR